MITRQDLPFSSFRSELTRFRLHPFLAILIRIIRWLGPSETACKLEFYARMQNYLRLIGLMALAGNNHVNLKHKKVPQNHEERIIQSFVEFLFQFNLIVKTNGRFHVNPKFGNVAELNLPEIMAGKNISLVPGLNHTERKLIIDFLFIKDLVRKYRNPDHALVYVRRNIQVWEKMLTGRKLDYEVRICETLCHLSELQIPGKIKSPFDEDYYTESGQNAFRNFTRPAFIAYLNQIRHNNPPSGVLDLGCGYGNYIEAMQECYPHTHITGLEINPRVCEITGNKYKNNDHVIILNRNFFAFEPIGKYDIILMNYVFFYFDYHEKIKLMNKAREILDDDGSVIMCQYFSGIETLKRRMAKLQNDYGVSRRIEMYYGDKILYANTLWNDAVDTFAEAVRWNELLDITRKTGWYIESITPADRFYYSHFIQLTKKG